MRPIQSPSTSFAKKARDATGGAQIDVFDDGGLPEASELEPGEEASVVALGDLAIDHEGEPLFEGKGIDIGLPELIVEGLGHADEAECEEASIPFSLL